MLTRIERSTAFTAAAGGFALAASVVGTTLVGAELRWLVNSAWTVAAGLATVLTWRASHAVEDGRDRVCWRLFTAAAALWLAGAILRDILNFTAYTTTLSPGPALLWQAAAVAAIVGLAQGSSDRRPLYRLFVLDALPVVCLAVAIVQIASGEPLRLTWSQEYVIGFAAAYALLGLVALQLLARATHAVPLLVLFTGFLVSAVAGIVWAAQAVRSGVPQGTAGDVLWTVAFALVALAAALRRSTASQTLVIRDDEEGALRSAPPALAVLALVALQGLVADDYDALLYVLTSVATTVIVARFYVARTEVARTARRLTETNAQLREVDRLKDGLIALVSHELRTPLTSIRGYLQIVRDGDGGPVTEEQARFLDVALRNAQRLEHVVSDLLFVAEVDAGRLRLDRAPADLRTLVRDAAASAEPAAHAAELTLVVEAPVEVAARVDAVRIGQLLDNLVSNAIKFTPRGGTVTVSLLPERDRARIVVADTGAGVSAAERERLFERFYRTRAATSAAVPGTGLGLTIVRVIADAHDASIEVESEPGRGTSIAVSFSTA